MTALRANGAARQVSRTVAILVGLAACTPALLSSQQDGHRTEIPGEAATDAAIFEAVLVAVTESSSMGKGARVDPRVVSASAVVIDSAGLVPASEDRIERRRERVRGMGYAEGDVFLGKECTSAGRITVTQGYCFSTCSTVPSPPSLSTTTHSRSPAACESRKD
jgi:hypothetical protein